MIISADITLNLIELWPSKFMKHIINILNNSCVEHSITRMRHTSIFKSKLYLTPLVFETLIDYFYFPSLHFICPYAL